MTIHIDNLMHASEHDLLPRSGEHGSVLIAITLLTVPLIILVAATMASMTSRNSRLLHEVSMERALLAAESGLDEAIFQSNVGMGLKTGVPIKRMLQGGMSFVVEPTFLMTDGIDSNGDGKVDESAENIFQLIIDGSYRGTTRRIAAYLGPLPALLKIESSVMMHNSVAQFKLENKIGAFPYLNGNDKNLDGTAGPAPAIPGLTIAPPGTLLDLQSMVKPMDQLNIHGLGLTPSMAVASGSVDMVALRTAIANAANIILTEHEYKNQTFGNAATGDYEIVYRNGEVEFEGNVSGAGILYVHGELEVEHGFRWDGLIIVDGGEEFEAKDKVLINGAVILGDGIKEFELKEQSVIQYSSEAIAAVSSMLPGKYVAFNGWQEVSAK